MENKLTYEDFLKLNIKGLEMLLNNKVKDVNFSSIEKIDIRGKMLESIKKCFSNDFEIRASTWDNANVSITNKKFRYCLELGIGTKNTNEIKQVTKLRSKYVCVPGKVKVRQVCTSFSLPFFEKFNPETFQVIVDKNSYTLGETSFLDVSESSTFGEIMEHSFLKKMMESAFDEDILDEINTLAAQPLVKKLHLSSKKDIKKILKGKFDDELDSDENAWFDIAVKLTMESNKDLYPIIIDNIIKGKYE